MIPAVSTTEIAPRPVRPTLVASRMGSQSLSGAAVPPTRRLWMVSWRSAASLPANVWLT